jgi:mycothiol synthase
LTASSRPYQSEQDFVKLQSLLAQSRAAVAQAHYLHTGDLTWQLFHMLVEFDPSQIVRLWEDSPGLPIGFVLLYPRFGGFNLQVHPGWRNQELEAAMLMWAETQLHMLRQRDLSGCSTLVNERDVVLSTLLKSRGYGRAEEWLYMQHPLAMPIETLQPPQGFLIRALSATDDIDARATVLGRAFEAPPLVESYRRLMLAPGYDMELDLVAVASDGQFGAFALGWLDQTNKLGQFEPVGTAPAFRRRGLARAVLIEGLHRMHSRGAKSAIVIVEASEQAARLLYESVGFEVAWKLYGYAK